MKAYVFKKFSRISRVLADEHRGFLTWPGTFIPYLDQDELSKHPNKNNINEMLNQAEESEAICKELWQNNDVMEMTLKVEDSVQ